MWRRLWCGGSSTSVLKQALSTAEATAPPVWRRRRRSSILLLPPPTTHSYSSTGDRRIPLLYHHYSASSFCSASDKEKEKEKKEEGEHITCEEAKRLMRLVNVESLKTKLGAESSKEVIPYNQLVETCQAMGVARSPAEAAAFARVLDDAGVVLLFRDKVYLHPQKVVDLIRNAVPLALTPEDDPMRDELKMLQEKKDEIDVLAHKEVRRILWCGLGLAVMQVSLFFRLTFWEFSWDVMEPIAFFVTSSGIVVGYAYFLFTSRDPTYQDFMKRLFLSRQKKLFKKLNFNVDRFKELQQKCTVPLHSTTSKRKPVGWDLELVDKLTK